MSKISVFVLIGALLVGGHVCAMQQPQEEKTMFKVRSFIASKDFAGLREYLKDVPMFVAASDGFCKMSVLNALQTYCFFNPKNEAAKALYEELLRENQQEAARADRELKSKMRYEKIKGFVFLGLGFAACVGAAAFVWARYFRR